MDVDLMFRLKGTVILRIWWQILLVLFYTAGLVSLHVYVPWIRMDFPETLINILGVVIGLLLVFRTDTAYDRYWEGRQKWSEMTMHIRMLTRGIWVGVKEREGRDVVEKRSAINLLIAFVIATKHYLREEYSYDFDDIKDLISHLRKFATPSSTQMLENQIKRNKFMAHDPICPSNIPIELSYYISSYITEINQRGLIDPNMVSPMLNAVSGLVDCLTSFERILRTPIPMAYSVHLHHSTWLYILTLPFQMVGALVWWTIPVVGLASFSLLGILSIGWEIENPFGYDDNDLPLDDFCNVLRREVQMICSNALPSLDEWMFSSENHPLSPDNWMTATDMARKSVKEVHRLIWVTATATDCTPKCHNPSTFSVAEVDEEDVYSFEDSSQVLVNGLDKGITKLWKG